MTTRHRHGIWALTWRYLLVTSALLLILTGILRDPRWAESGLTTAPVLRIILELSCFIAAIALIQLRYRYPVWVTVALCALSLFADSAIFVCFWSFIALCTRRRWAEIVPVTVVCLVATFVEGDLGLLLVDSEGFNRQQLARAETSWNPAGSPITTELIIATLTVGVLLAIGLYIGERRDLIASLRARAEQAVREQQLRVTQGQAAERQRIAREMHDVLAHRISLVSVYSGALAYRDDLSVEQTREIAETIRENANLALTELRGVLGSLRGDDGDRPQPDLSCLDQLVADNRAGGMHIDYTPTTLDGISPTVSRHAYRIIQESLTNARKHAPGAKVSLKVSGDPTSGLKIRVSNPVREWGTTIPGAGYGLIGLSERVQLVGGRIEHGFQDWHFVVEAWLPW